MFMQHMGQRRRLDAFIDLALGAVVVFATLTVTLALTGAAQAASVYPGDAAMLATMLAAPERHASPIEADQMFAMATVSGGFVVMSAASVAFWRGLVQAEADRH